MVMNDLPVQISSLFILKEKMTGNKTEILNFCDSIQDLVETNRPNEAEIQESEQPSARMEMESFDFTPEEESMSPKPIRGRGRGRRASVRGGMVRGRPTKKLKKVMEDNNESRDSYDFLDQMDITSRSSWSEGY